MEKLTFTHAFYCGLRTLHNVNRVCTCAGWGAGSEDYTMGYNAAVDDAAVEIQKAYDQGLLDMKAWLEDGGKYRPTSLPTYQEMQ